MTNDDSKGFVLAGRLEIPVANLPALEALSEEIHELILANKPIPDELRRRGYILQGASEETADLLMLSPEGGELNDCHEVD